MNKPRAVRLIMEVYDYTPEKAEKYLAAMLEKDGLIDTKQFIERLAIQVQKTFIKPYSNS